MPQHTKLLCYEVTQQGTIVKIQTFLWFLKDQCKSLALDCSQSPIFPCNRRCTCESLNASETGESTKCPWIGVVEGTAGGKNGKTVTVSLCLLFRGVVEIWRPYWSNQLTVSSLEKKPVKSVSVAHEIDSMQLLSWVQLMPDEKSLLTAKKRQSPQV